MQSPRVLVVDDDPIVSALIHALLCRHGYVCELVSDGETAIDRLRAHDYAAVVLDLMLPGAFGPDVIRFLRAERPSMAERVVVVTAGSPAMLRDFDRSSVCAVLQKPFDIDELVETVDACATGNVSRVPASCTS